MFKKDFVREYYNIHAKRKFMKKYKGRSAKKIKVRIYELNHVREIEIDLTSGKDRAKLKHILEHEHHRLRKRDIDRFYGLLNK